MKRRNGLSRVELEQLHEVAIEASIRNQLDAYATTATIEVCAALFGHADGPSLTILGWRQLNNVEASKACFAVSVDELLGSRGSDDPYHLVGLFHSHVEGPAWPSDMDRLSIASFPFVWVIAAREDDDLRAFGWSRTGVRELVVRHPGTEPSRRADSGPLGAVAWRWTRFD